jgi:hypothetical protein
VARRKPAGANDEMPALDQTIPGFSHITEWAEVVCDWPALAPRDGAKPLHAELCTSLTIGEAMEIQEAMNTTVGQISPRIAPFVRSWNVTARNAKTGAFEPVPPPAEIGVDAFKSTRPGVVAFLAITLLRIHNQGGPDRPKETMPSDDTSDGESVAA